MKLQIYSLSTKTMLFNVIRKVYATRKGRYLWQCNEADFLKVLILLTIFAES